MATATSTLATQATQPATTATPDLAALKTRQQAAWSSGNYAIVGTTLQIVGEQLCEALDIMAGSKVLDVAAGNGNGESGGRAPLVRVTSTDYVPALLEQGHARAEAEGASSISARRTPKTCRSPTTASTWCCRPSA